MTLLVVNGAKYSLRSVSFGYASSDRGGRCYTLRLGLGNSGTLLFVAPSNAPVVGNIKSVIDDLLAILATDPIEVFFDKYQSVFQGFSVADDALFYYNAPTPSNGAMYFKKPTVAGDYIEGVFIRTDEDDTVYLYKIMASKFKISAHAVSTFSGGAVFRLYIKGARGGYPTLEYVYSRDISSLHTEHRRKNGIRGKAIEITEGLAEKSAVISLKDVDKELAPHSHSQYITRKTFLVTVD